MSLAACDDDENDDDDGHGDDDDDDDESLMMMLMMMGCSIVWLACWLGVNMRLMLSFLHLSLSDSLRVSTTGSN
eukprot:6483691-Amphidinium_carterae.1